jgi:serpin B
VWQHSFHPHGTWPGTFFCLDGSHAEASFMKAFGTILIACLMGSRSSSSPTCRGGW